MILSTSRRAAVAVSGCLYDFSSRIGAPERLRELGLDHAVLDEPAKIAVDVVVESLRGSSLDAIRTVLENAWSDEHSA
jgi:alcohol dehydrogenase class IV